MQCHSKGQDRKLGALPIQSWSGLYVGFGRPYHPLANDPRLMRCYEVEFSDDEGEGLPELALEPELLLVLHHRPHRTE
jgi:hypothetical protein